ncbi:DUF3783 domain-containing protein [Thermococcus sp. 21S9]|uniref:DUF3783 domain-containing protein n=1 Tax=Thermococcus sp. 21S9 TaxID=1638223 RepID=UPI00143B4B96|nr:DUF3783 domain-containing protein [Thermococcus sp. 21S9]NJE55388.1 DUF3783 domain-containing protein [Thermococcus sp. 21S9]
MKLLLVGFTEDEIERIAELGYPVLPVPEHFRKLTPAEILERTTEGGKLDWAGGKFLIMHGLDNEGIKRVINEVRKLAEGRVIFATTTETNLKWTLEELLDELRREDEYFRAMREAKKQVKGKKGIFLDIGNVK